jgi:cytidine deaminase
MSLDDFFAAAKQAQARAYAPYSRFKVGAAVRGGGGGVYSGCNVENAAYPAGTCAEEAAIAAMVAAGESRIAEVLVIGSGDTLEFASPQTAIHVAGPEGVRRSFMLEDLLPFSFGPDTLGRGEGDT